MTGVRATLRTEARTDAKGQKLERSEDSYGRVVELRKYPNGVTEDTTQRVTYYYDVNPINGSYTQNGWGRIAAVQYKRRSPVGAYDLTFTEQYSYTQGGLPTKKHWTMVKPFAGTGTLEALYSYDNEGRRTGMTYPGARALGGGPFEAGRTFAYQYDAVGRRSGMTEPSIGATWASAFQYNAASQLTSVSYVGGTETRSYNVWGQMTNLVSGSVNLEYRFSANQNNGRITSIKDFVSREEVNYTYDSLNRLLSAVTTGPEWGLSFTYDGFGNKTAQTVTKGTGPALSIGADPATNRVGSTDANGNLLTGSNNWCATADCYDVANRMVLTNGAPIGIG